MYGLQSSEQFTYLRTLLPFSEAHWGEGPLYHGIIKAIILVRIT